MTVCIGINPITWTNDDLPSLGGDTPLETCLKETKQAGYAGTEMGGKFPKRVADMERALGSHGLKLVSGWYSAALLQRTAAEEIAAMAGHLDLMAGMGCTVMVFAEGTESNAANRAAPASRHRKIADGEWKEYARRVTAVAEHMQKRGVRLAFHHHMGTAVQTEDEIGRLMRETGPAVGLLLDTGHATYAGADPLVLARKHAKRIVHVHCKDVRRPVLDRALEEGLSFLDAVLAGVFTVPGDGDVDFPPILKLLREQGYAGWLVVEAEQDPAKAHPLTYARMGFDYLSNAAKAAGFVLD
jgi:inosose dehydratase